MEPAPSASRWALLGLGLALLMTLIVPITQAAVRQWMIHRGQSSPTISLAFGGLGVFWSMLRATSYILLFVAVFAGRPEPMPPPPGPTGQP